MFSGVWERDEGPLFIDRDPTAFAVLLRYLRFACKPDFLKTVVADMTAEAHGQYAIVLTIRTYSRHYSPYHALARAFMLTYFSSRFLAGCRSATRCSLRLNTSSWPMLSE